MESTTDIVEKGSVEIQGGSPDSFSSDETEGNFLARSRVLGDPDLLNEIFLYLKPRDLVTCRPVHSLWNNGSVSLLTQQDSFLKFRVYITKKVADDCVRDFGDFRDGRLSVHPSDLFRLTDFEQVCQVKDLHEFFSKMSQEERKNSLFRLTTFMFEEHKFLDEKKCDAHIPLFKDFGWMIQYLQISIENISDLFTIFGYCPNLMTLKVHFSQETDIVLEELNDTTGKTWNKQIMQYLRTLDVKYEVQWNIAKLLMEVTPNVTTLKCSDESQDYWGGPPKDPYHFTNELKKMPPDQLKVIKYKQAVHSDIVTEFLKLDLPTLTSFTIPCVANFNEKRHEDCNLVVVEWMKMLMKHASTLEAVFFDPNHFYAFKFEDEFPHLPRLTRACIPHNMVKTGDFFQKVPSLRKLKLHLDYYDDVLRQDEMYCEENGVRYERCGGGFMAGNEGLWRKCGDWLPHRNLNVLELEIEKRSFIPETLADIFPSLRVLHLKITDKSLRHLGNFIRVMKDHQCLTEFALGFGRDDSWGRRCMPYAKVELELRIAYVLMGISVEILDELPKAIQDWTTVKFEHLFTESSLRDMTSLRSFTMKCGILKKNEWEKVAELLDMYCFAQMPRLQDKKVLYLDLNS